MLIPKCGYFTFNLYFYRNRAKMKVRRSILLLPVIVSIAAIPFEGSIDHPSYILKRSFFKTCLSSINISPDGNRLMAGFQDGSLAILDAVTFVPVLEVDRVHLKAVNAMDMPPNMDFFLSAGSNSIFLWDLAGNKLATWTGHATTIWNAEISKDGKFAVSSEFNKTFLLWDVAGNTLKEKMQGHDDVALSVSISPDNRLIASGSSDQTIRIWLAGDRRVIRTINGPSGEIYDLAFSPDSRLLAAACKDRTVRVYDAEEGSLLHLLKGHRDMVMEAEFSPDGRYLVSGSADHSLILWDVVSGDQIHSFPENEEALLDLVFHPDGRSFYSISFAGDLTRWSIDPEIFVTRYFETPYREELSADPLFQPRYPGEARKEYELREQEAAVRKAGIIQKYYLLYLDQYRR